MRVGRWVLTGVAISLLTGGVLAGIRYGTDPGRDSGRLRAVASYISYKDVDTMTASADIVVYGTVVSTKPGRTIAPPNEGSLRMLESTLEVKEFVYTREGHEVPPVVRVEEAAWVDGVPYEVDGMPWTKEGDKGYFFLRLDPTVGAYGYIGAQARILESDQGIVVRSDDHHEDPMVHKYEKTRPGDFRETLKDAAKAAKEGKVERRPLGDYLPRAELPTHAPTP